MSKQRAGAGPSAGQYHRALDRAILIVVGQNRANIFSKENPWPEIEEGLALLAARPDLPTTVTLVDLMDARGIVRPVERLPKKVE